MMSNVITKTHQSCDQWAMSRTFKCSKEHSSHFIFVIVAFGMTMCLVTVKASSMIPLSEQDFPKVYIECEEYPEDLLRQKRSIASEAGARTSKKSERLLNKFLVHDSVIERNQKSWERREGKKLKTLNLKAKIEMLKKKLRRSRFNIKKLKRRLHRLWKKRRRPSTKKKLVNKGPKSVVFPTDSNVTLAWECKYKPQIFTTRGYPESIRTGVCTTRHCAGLNDFYICKEKTYDVPYLLQRTGCIDFPLQSRFRNVMHPSQSHRRNNRNHNKKIKIYEFRWHRAVVDCVCERNHRR